MIDRSQEIGEAILSDLANEHVGPNGTTQQHVIWAKFALRKDGERDGFEAALAWAEREGYLQRGGEGGFVLTEAGYDRSRTLQGPVGDPMRPKRPRRKFFDFLP